MVKRGPKTPDEIRAEAVLIPGNREPTPDDLEEGARILWDAIVVRLPADFFTSETRPLLKAYCRHANFADHFAKDITAMRATIEAIETSGKNIRKLPKLREHLYALHKLHGYETDHAVSCATRLRLTNQSRFVPEKAASKARSALASGPPPWHDWGTPETVRPDA